MEKTTEEVSTLPIEQLLVGLPTYSERCLVAARQLNHTEAIKYYEKEMKSLYSAGLGRQVIDTRNMFVLIKRGTTVARRVKTDLEVREEVSKFRPREEPPRRIRPV